MSFEEEFKKLVDEKGDEAVEEMISKLTKLYGSPPLVTRVLAEDKLNFITCILKNNAILHREDGPLNEKVIELLVISAATALRCEHCIEQHIQRAYDLGVSKKAVLQTIMIASTIAETSSWSTGFRKYRQVTAKFESKSKKAKAK